MVKINSSWLWSSYSYRRLTRSESRKVDAPFASPHLRAWKLTRLLHVHNRHLVPRQPPWCLKSGRVP